MGEGREEGREEGGGGQIKVRGKLSWGGTGGRRAMRHECSECIMSVSRYARVDTGTDTASLHACEPACLHHEERQEQCASHYCIVADAGSDNAQAGQQNHEVYHCHVQGVWQRLVQRVLRISAAAAVVKGGGALGVWEHSAWCVCVCVCVCVSVCVCAWQHCVAVAPLPWHLMYLVQGGVTAMHR